MREQTVYRLAGEFRRPIVVFAAHKTVSSSRAALNLALRLPPRAVYQLIGRLPSGFRSAGGYRPAGGRLAI